MPQKWEANWSLIPAEGSDAVDLNAVKTDEKAAAARDRDIQTFGNLTLLTQKLNSSVSNGPFDSKRNQITENSALRLNRYFINLEKWDEDSILDRGRSLFQIARKIWQYPTND